MKMKLTSLLLLAIFLISLFPATMAEETGGNTGTSNTETGSGDSAETSNTETGSSTGANSETGSTGGNTGADDTTSNLRNSPVANAKRSPEVTAQLRAKLQERLNKLPEKARLRWDEVNQKRVEKIAKLKELKVKPEFKKFKQELNFKVRQVNIEKLKEAKQNYGQAVKNLVRAREKSKEAHQAFLDAKKDFKACTENCEEMEAQTLQNAKDFLIRTADTMISHLEKVKTTVQSNEDLTDEEASEMITKIDAEIKELQDAKAKVTAATTKEELKAASKTILEAWKKINRYTLFHIAKIVNSKHGGIIVKLKHLELRLQKVLEKMEENGKDTSTIQPLVDEFNKYLEEAKTKFNLAEQKFKEFKALPEPKGEAGNKLIQEAQGYMKEARESLKNAQEKLKEIVKAVKDAEGNTELAETTTEEAEDIDDGDAEDTDDSDSEDTDDNDAEDTEETEEETE